MALPTYSGKDKRYGFAEQTTWGTAIADAGTFNEVDSEAFTIDPDIQIREQSGSHATRAETYNDMTATSSGAVPTFTVTGDAKYNEFDYFLYAFFQNVTEGATTPFDKTFTYPSTQPDFHDDAGFFVTWLEAEAIESASTKVHDCVSSQLTISCAPRERVKYSQEWKSSGSGTSTADASSATFSRASLEYWYFEDIDRATINFGAGASSVTLVDAWEISLQQDLMPVGHDGSGNFQTFHIPKRTGTFKLVINDDANVASAKANLRSDTAITVNLGWGNATPGTDDGDLDITFTGKIEKVTPNNGDLLGFEITGKILAPDASTAPITVVTANAQDRSW